MPEPELTEEQKAAKEKRDALKAVIKESLQEIAAERAEEKKKKKKHWTEDLLD